VAREAGHRSKVAVAARQDGTDPVGCCVGLRGIRIQSIVNELNDEKIDVVQWADNAKVFIANSLSPAQVSGVELSKTDSMSVVIVPDKQLSLAIGKDGQNARLAAKLTGWRIDIKSISALEKERVEQATAAMEVAVAEKRTRKKAVVSETPPEPVLEPVAVGAEAEKSEKAKAEKSAEGKTVALADYDLGLTTAQSTKEQSPPAQIRFAEDILHKTGGIKKKTGKKESDIKPKGAKVKKPKGKQFEFEGDEY
jgi:N utilization substance protein A